MQSCGKTLDKFYGGVMVSFYCRFPDPEPWQCPLVAREPLNTPKCSGRPQVA